VGCGVNIADVMDELGTALGTIPELRVFPYWADRVTPPAAVVAWPDPLTFDATMGRGLDRMTIPVIVMVGAFNSRTTRDAMAKYLAGSGDMSVKQAIERHHTNAYDSVRVRTAEVNSYTVGGTELLAATFDVDLIGTGA
jgi:hypothetical protein